MEGSFAVEGNGVRKESRKEKLTTWVPKELKDWAKEKDIPYPFIFRVGKEFLEIMSPSKIRELLDIGGSLRQSVERLNDQINKIDLFLEARKFDIQRLENIFKYLYEKREEFFKPLGDITWSLRRQTEKISEIVKRYESLRKDYISDLGKRILELFNNMENSLNLKNYVECKKFLAILRKNVRKLLSVALNIDESDLDTFLILREEAMEDAQVQG